MPDNFYDLNVAVDGAEKSIAAEIDTAYIRWAKSRYTVYSILYTYF
jgi:hypothetical protein